MKKFKLMQVLPSLNSGGVEQGTIDLANYLASLEIKNYVTSNGGRMLSYLNKNNVDHNTLPVHSKNFFKMPFVAKKINEYVKNKNINIIHIRSRAPSWLLPYIDRNNIKITSTFHNVYGHTNFIKRLYNQQLSNVDRIVAISNYVKSEITKKYKINPEKITTIYRGIDTEYFNGTIDDQSNFIKFLNDNNIDSSKKIILFPGRLTNWKGQLEFLKIIEYFKDDPVVFYFVGDDKNKSFLKKLVDEISKKQLFENCKILGHLKKNELKMIYQCCNLVISAPLKPEGFGRTIGESLSMKKIILAYNFGGAYDQLKGLDSLYMVDPYNIDELKKKIKNVISMESDTVSNLGVSGRSHIISNFSKNKMLESYLNFYEQL